MLESKEDIDSILNGKTIRDTILTKEDKVKEAIETISQDRIRKILEDHKDLIERLKDK